MSDTSTNSLNFDHVPGWPSLDFDTLVHLRQEQRTYLFNAKLELEVIRKKTSDPAYFTGPRIQVEELTLEKKLIEYHANVTLLNMLVDRRIQKDGVRLATNRFDEYTSEL